MPELFAALFIAALRRDAITPELLNAAARHLEILIAERADRPRA